MIDRFGREAGFRSNIAAAPRLAPGAYIFWASAYEGASAINGISRPLGRRILPAGEGNAAML